MHIMNQAKRAVSAALAAAITATVIAFPAVPVSAATIGKKIAMEDKYLGYTADYGSSGIKSLTFYVTCTEACNFCYGFGIGTAAKPYWVEMANGKLVEGDGEGTNVALEAGVSTPIKIDVSKYTLSYNPKSDEYPGKFEFRNYYIPDDSTLTLDKIVANETSSSTTTPTTPSTSTTGKAAKSGTFSFKDNKDGTATVSSTLSGTVDELDFLLTAGKDEESYTEDGINTWKEGDPINSRKITYKEFGLPDLTGSSGSEDDKLDEKITLESFTFSVESKTNMDTFMYGCGLNVEHKSPADTEYWLNPDSGKGYWYNEHGLDEDGKPEKGIEDLEIEVGTGTTLEDAGKWIEAEWIVPDAIKEYTRTQPADAISFQYWYGANKEDGYEEVKSCTLKSATCTYTYEKTIPYSFSDSIKCSEKLTQGDEKTNSANIAYSKGSNNDGIPRAIKFTVEASSEIKKLVFGVGTSDKASAKEFTQQQFAILNAGKKQEIMWILPDSIEADAKYGSVYFGYYYGADSKDKEVSSVTLSDITVYYEELPAETTTTPAPVTTTVKTTTTPAPTVEADWGDVTCDGQIDISDAVLTCRYAVSDAKAKVTDQGKINGDVTHDGALDAEDATKLLQYIAKIIKREDLGKA